MKRIEGGSRIEGADGGEGHAPPCGMVVEEEAVNGVEVAAVILELVLEHRGGGEEGQVPEGGQVQGEGAERRHHGAEWWCM